MTVYMSAVVPTTTLTNVSVLAATSIDITVGSADLSAFGSGTTVYVTDGTRAWRYTTTLAGQQTFSVGNTDLLISASPFTIADYTAIQNNSFRMYVGTLVTAFSAGSPAMSADIGSFDNVLLGDSATLGDAILGDGVWTGLYNVPDLGFTVASGKLFGQCVVSSVIGSNSPMQSVVSFSLDGVRPSIETVLFKTTKANYNGILYLSSLSQGTTAPHPTNAQGRFDITVNKKNTQVDISIDTTPVTKQLAPLLIPANAINPNGWKIWNGDDGSSTPIFAGDRVYTASLYIKDEHGVTGLTRTVEVRVVSIKPEIKNIVLNPPAINTFPAIVDSVITVISHRLEISNDSGTTLRPSLNVLNWKELPPPLESGAPIANFNQTDNLESMVYSVNERDFLAPSGDIGIEISKAHDYEGTFDTDAAYVVFYRADPKFTPPDCYPFGLSMGDPFATSTAGALADTGDNLLGNDWDGQVFNFLTVTSGTTTDPLRMGMNYSMYVRGDTPAQGSYRLAVRSILSGIMVRDAVEVGGPLSVVDYCATTPTPKYRAELNHFYPTARPESGDPTTYTGFGVFAEDTSMIFSVNSNQPSTTDSTPPLFLSSNPQDGSTVTDVFGSNAFGPSKPLTAQIQDVETPINLSGGLTYIRVKAPDGGYVGGTASHNGGGSNNTATISFTPNATMSIGGDYIMEVRACNQSGLCIQKDVLFKIQDQTPASVAGLELVSQASSGTLPLTLFQTAPDGPYSNITEVWAFISIPSTSQNEIAWDNCTITLQRISGTSTINIPMTRQTALGTVPSDNKIKYKLVSPIKDAGLFEVVVQTFATDASDNVFSGPAAGFVNPRFTTITNVSTLSVSYPFGSPSPREAISGTQPITVSAGGPSFTPLTSNTMAVVPNFSGLSANPGYSAITSSATGGHALQFNFNSTLATGTVTWQYPAASPLQFTLYYDDVDLPPSVTHSSLRVYGYVQPSWYPISTGSISHVFTNVTGNTFTIAAPNGTSTNQNVAAYAIFYPAAAAPGVTPTATPTALPFPQTRSFNPAHANPLYRKAKIYYATTAPKELEVKVYDTSGVLVRTIGLGSGASLADIQTDPFYGQSQYFFTWDGLNDSGGQVKNGIYLLRYKVTRMDNSTEAQTRMVALIK